MALIPVELGDRSYKILIGANFRHEIQKVLEGLVDKKRYVVVITDENIASAQRVFFEETFDRYECPRVMLIPGEKHKSIRALEESYNSLADHGVDRTSVIFAVGGGVVGDVGGFIASTYMRGIDYYQIPTTFLAMIDSSIGGKTGINLRAGKNLVGSFYQPKGVLIDTDFLKTLPAREFGSGMAEVIKYALLADEDFFNELEKNDPVSANSPQIISLIQKACQIKVGIIQEDERDQKGKRALLNLGHTFGHAIEAAAGYGEYLHGEAVSIGLIMAARLSELLGYLGERELMRIKSVVEKYGLPTKLKTPISIFKLNEAMHHDKKIETGRLHFVLLKAIGEAYKDKNINKELLYPLWREMGAKD